MEDLKFTQLAPHARMMAVTSIRNQVDSKIDDLRAALTVYHSQADLPFDEQPEDLDSNTSQASKSLSHALRRARSMADDIHCIEYLRDSDVRFTAEGHLMERELWELV